jgi:indolepyruvate ferredoxin oxidoreductase alpha subunit
VEQRLLSGNEAVARGAWEAGVTVGVGYPGTPSTEVLEEFARLPGVVAQWAPNEKVAFEVAAGVSVGGARTLVTMKHVGLNVAADVLFTMAYTGVGGGLVVLVADDPGMHSSQNEQDSRNYAAFAKVPMLEPSDSAETLAFTKLAFEISERFDTPVLVRSTIRIAHSKGLVTTGRREEREVAPYRGDPAKYLMLPANGRRRRQELASRLRRIAEYGETLDRNLTVMNDLDVGIITSGVTFQYVREGAPRASVLKLAMTYPMPEGVVRAFASKVRRLVVVEELDPYLSLRVRALGLEVDDVALKQMGEYTPGRIAEAFGRAAPPTREAVEDLPPRPPMLCPGCPHRGVFWGLRKMKAVVMGDIGCYTLGALPPLAAMDTCVEMGASIGMAYGLELAGSAGERPVVAVLGDSTFAHSGLTGMMNVVYNGGATTTVILDNRVTAMTGHQENPFTGRTLMGDPAPDLDIQSVCRALGVARVAVVDPNDLREVERVLREETSRPEPSVVIARRPCALLQKAESAPYAVDQAKCTACGICVSLGCPAISKSDGGRAVIDLALCVGCAQCVAVCRYDAIVPAGPACSTGGTP